VGGGVSGDCYVTCGDYSVAGGDYPGYFPMAGGNNFVGDCHVTRGE